MSRKVQPSGGKEKGAEIRRGTVGSFHGVPGSLQNGVGISGHKEIVVLIDCSNFRTVNLLTS